METWMNSNRPLTVLLCLLSFVLASCGHSSSNNASLRIMNAIPDAPSISVQLGTNPPLITGMLFQQLTQYMSVSGGSQDFMVSANGGQSFAINETLNMGSGSYTYVVYGPIVWAAGFLIYDTAVQTFTNGDSYEAVVFTKGSARLVSMALLDENSTGTGQVLANLLADFKV